MKTQQDEMLLKQPLRMGRRSVEIVLAYGIYVLFAVLCVAVALTSEAFLTWANIKNVLLQTSIIATIAIGMTLVIITQGIDLSVGAVMAVASGAGVGLIKIAGAPWWLAMLAMIGVGLAFGLVNGMAVAYLRMPAFLVTLATMGVARGLTLAMSGGRSWFGLPEPFTFLREGSIGPLPMLVAVVLLMYLVGYGLLHHTVFGRHVYAVGGNPDAARVSGINTTGITLAVYVICGLFTGLAAVLQSARLNAFWAAMGSGLEFSVIAAVVIGGTSLFGGTGTIAGTLLGVLMMGVINNALNLWGISAYWQDAARGLIIFIAVMLDSLRHRFTGSDSA